jgi:AraC-like DNA-binding protein
MRYTEFPPPASLADIVHCFWFLSGNLGGADAQPVVADGRLELILHLAEPFEAPDTTMRWRPQASVLVAGQLTAPTQVRPVGESDVIGIRLCTDGAQTLLAIPLHELTDRVVPLVELAPALADSLLMALRGIKAPAQRIDAMTSVLNRHRRGALDQTVRSMLKRLDQSRAPAISSLAENLGLTARTVERRVGNATGLAPVDLRAVMRFRRSYRLLEAAPVGHWGRVALSGGYYDQAHCIREFRRFTGAAPTAWFGRVTELADAFLIGRIERVKA